MTISIIYLTAYEAMSNFKYAAFQIYWSSHEGPYIICCHTTFYSTPCQVPRKIGGWLPI